MNKKSNNGIIENKANADRLFNQLLILIKNKKEYKGSLIIEELEKLIRINKGNMNNSTYDQSILRMLSNVKDRDYFIFEKKEVKKIIDEECRKINRDNGIWKKFKAEKISINPKYL